MSYELIHGDARHVSQHVAHQSVDLIVTSPPYFALRSYQDGGQHYDGQIGSEPTPTEFLDALVACTADWMTVLKPGGSIWVNLGDKYSGAGGPGGDYNKGGLRDGQPRVEASDYWSKMSPSRNGIPAKSLMGLPWRYALRCVDELGLILRAEVVWAKPNGLPESVTDRVRRSHEQWFHFTMQPRYFSAVDEIREPHNYDGKGLTWEERKAQANRYSPDAGHGSGGFVSLNPLGKLPGSVWTIPTEPLRVPAELGIDHFAAFPSEWPRRIILGWTPNGICTACGYARRPVVEKVTTGHDNGTRAMKAGHRGVGMGSIDKSWVKLKAEHPDRIVGYACACPTPDAPTTPAVVLDPFGGTGTTAAVAHHLGRHGIHLDLSRDYLRLADWRINHDERLRRKVLERSGHLVEKPVNPDQLGLFGDDAA